MKTTLLLFLFAIPGLAQKPGTVELKGSLGYTGFTDDRALIGHLQTGTSARIYLTRRFSIEPEFQYLRGGDRHYDLIVVPNVNWDFRPGSRTVPYITGGVGWMRSTDRTPFFRFSYSQTFVQVGTGVKLRISDRWYVAPELRVGSELHIRASASLAYRFPR